MKSLIILKFMVLLFMVLTLSQFTNGLLDVTRACEIALNRFERNKEMIEGLWQLQIKKPVIFSMIHLIISFYTIKVLQNK